MRISQGMLGEVAECDRAYAAVHCQLRPHLWSSKVGPQPHNPKKQVRPCGKYYIVPSYQ